MLVVQLQHFVIQQFQEIHLQCCPRKTICIKQMQQMTSDALRWQDDRMTPYTGGTPVT